MNITRREDEPGKVALSFIVGITHIVVETELLEALAEAGVLKEEVWPHAWPASVTGPPRRWVEAEWRETK